ncbi:MAG: hypothetical protein GWO16_05850 [Gammaproteobacteria bacterium]|nr:hypothetical protein [Gammaproteobacteria bacterium]NIR97573.1 hypothetical protein [Gammaproteobacteria bacterium]NIT63217.1 hypothetical protein [Gammaproteobacteria bacterium]NIV20154.1 hypothetical protein [Gammaproteobacteria bacterium]NIY31797.1 hypothetical protein [Gammaproteobacteria bacterium]
MPKHIEFVLAAYGIWSVTIMAYLLYLRHRSGKAWRALERLGTKGGGASAGS